jgi:hypothetical protein
MRSTSSWSFGWISCWWMDKAIMRWGELRRASSSSSSVSDVKHRLAAAMTAPSELDELESSVSLARLVFSPAMARSTVRRVFCLAADDTMPYNAWTISRQIRQMTRLNFELSRFLPLQRHHGRLTLTSAPSPRNATRKGERLRDGRDLSAPQHDDSNPRKNSIFNFNQK